EHDQVGGLLVEQLAQARAPVTQRHVEVMQAQVVTDHLARWRFVVDYDDMLGAGAHDAVAICSRMMKVAPRPGPSLSALTLPPCSSTMRLTIDRPSPVELSPPVGLAVRRWKRPNRRAMSSCERPGPSSLTRIAMPPSSTLIDNSVRPPTGVYLIALLTRLSTASRIRSGSQFQICCGGDAK